MVRESYAVDAVVERRATLRIERDAEIKPSPSSRSARCRRAAVLGARSGGVDDGLAA